MIISAESKLKELLESIESLLSQMGVMYRIFGRVKDFPSLQKKLDLDERYGSGKLLQDYIGVRVVLYFPDDIDIVHKALSSFYSEREKDQSIDSMNDSTFKPVRYNLVYEIPGEVIFSGIKEFEGKIDNTFELQIRTVLSEGWHEVEHDLRYKCGSDWEGFPTESRKLNGVYASLETNEWTMIKIFDEIAYGHYKNGNWESMLRQKLRLRLSKDSLDKEIIDILDGSPSLAKKFFRIDRSALMYTLNQHGYGYPVNLNNLVYFSNLFFVGDEKIMSLTPDLLKEYKKVD